ncbi:MAG: hypothetical protein GX443_08140 [Deltaproteobacteria bacterium]|nr:hypothetical protein [Deltaproteobacteria bacterium]
MDEFTDSPLTMAQRAALSWNYLQSWSDGQKRLHGIIATYWDSSPDCTDPHVMNHFPVIEGLKILYDRFGCAKYISLAVDYGEFLSESYDRSSKLFRNAWGDLPGKNTGPVHQSASAGALLDLYSLTSEDRYLSIAVESLKSTNDHWPSPLLNGVANQALKYVQAVVKLKKLSPEDFLVFMPKLHEFRQHLDHLTQPAARGALLDQSVYSSMLMTVYEAKCLHGLKALADGDIEKEWALTAINRIVKGIVDTLYCGNGVFLSHRDYSNGFLGSVIRYTTAALRRLPWPDGGVLLERARRGLLKTSCQEATSIGPVWLARLADLAFALIQVEDCIEEPISGIREEVVRLIARKQLPHGGVPNCIGPWITGWHAWERLVCCTRWNAYVFRLFCTLAEEKPDLNSRHCSTSQWGDAYLELAEDWSRVSCIQKAEKTKLEWRKPSSMVRQES